MADDRDQRRRFPRVHSENLVLVKKSGDQPVEGLGKTEQLGLGGCKFLHQEPLGVGSIVELTLSIRGKLINTKGRVAYEVPHEGAFTEVGVEFLQLTDDDRAALVDIFGTVGTVFADG
jgi:hypothetical protein